MPWNRRNFKPDLEDTIHILFQAKNLKNLKEALQPHNSGATNMEKNAKKEKQIIRIQFSEKGIRIELKGGVRSLVWALLNNNNKRLAEQFVTDARLFHHSFSL